MRNLRQFYTTSDIDRKCLRRESRYPKSERHVTENDSLRVRRKKSCELWSTNQKVGHVTLNLSKWSYLGDYISALTRCAVPIKFLHALQIDEGVFAVGLAVPCGLKLGSVPYF